MKLSYIIPIYNVEIYLRQCIDSVLAQKMDDYEIILVDDGSPDNCPKICDEYEKSYPEKIKVIHKKNGGPSETRNVGLKAAKGDYVYFVDGDDYFVATNVIDIYDKAVEFNADIVQSSYVAQDDGIVSSVEKSPITNDILIEHSEMENFICESSYKRTLAYPWRNIYKRAFLIENDIKFETSLRMVEEGPFNMLAFSKAKRFLAVDIPVYCYRIRDNSLQRQKYVPDYDLIIEKQWELKLKYYEENCETSQAFYKDIGEYTAKAILMVLLRNVYVNDVKGKYALLKRIGHLKMIRKAFQDYDIDEYRSKSLDWWVTWLIEKNLYLPAHFLCSHVLYKVKK